MKVGHGEGGDENIKNGFREREKGRTFDNLFSHRLGAAVRHLLEMAEAENEFSLMYFISGRSSTVYGWSPNKKICCYICSKASEYKPVKLESRHIGSLNSPLW